MPPFTLNHDDGPRDGGQDDDPPPREEGLFPASGWIVAYCDGGSRGNPGPAGFGVYIEDAAGGILAEESEYLGARTNNFAEYSALLAAIDFALSHGHRCLRVISDSELIVKQVKGQYRVKSPELRPLYEQVRRCILALEKFEIRHVPREKNRHADRLANLAMDRGMKLAGQAHSRSAAAVAAGSPENRGALPLSLGEAESLREEGRKLEIPAPQGSATQHLAPKMLRGLVKNGMVHLLSGDLPDGTFVKVIPE